MANFFDRRKVIKVEDLRGPRVYSTDLAPSLYDANNESGSVLVTARALKIKIIAKGLVTLNCGHLVSPLAIRLFDKHPDLLDGEAIVPAFRRDKNDLADYIEDMERFTKIGIGRTQVEEHIARVNAAARQVLPWELADVGQRYCDMVVAGLRSDTSTISRQLDRDHGLNHDERDAIASTIQDLEFGTSSSLRDYTSKLQNGAGDPIMRFATACYHMVGTSVVRCETGTDLNPLSDFKMEDVLQAGQQQAELTEEAIFLKLFLATALDTIQSAAIPSQIIDALSFKHAHLLSGALRDQGFQQKYDEVIETYLNTASKIDKREALESIDPEAIGTTVSDLAKTFRTAVLAELPKYWTKEAAEAKSEFYRAATDLALDGAGTVPLLGNVVSGVGLMGGAANLVSAIAAMNDARGALTKVHERRNEKIRTLIEALSVNNKSKLLDGVALLADAHVAAIERA
ncbi:MULTISPECIES: hypothetical protein [unclassified Mesorhizobium]|uniref:hypothetical protein n=1 Tax=unclassified Mesorhizobium TaxID=325217 RepID=UPI0003D05CBD|nr:MULTISPECIES: hypothetical protein [unclassified Mesorhizobium]ESZ61440.1 hypothetical protein X728_12775 [Mesorhizobium sp. L103C120A0]WJI43577.1 hypothetical protein NL532_23485 [Mesorhizobium sp. C120A]